MPALPLKGTVLSAGREQIEGARSGKGDPSQELLQQPRPEVRAWTSLRSGQIPDTRKGRPDGFL